jgi:vacuolar-type H+-ATPase subunit C/Vma6
MKKIINGIEVSLTQEEILLKQQQDDEWNNGAFDRSLQQLRNYRNKLLNETDFYVIKAKENNEEVPANIKTYRQELRDLTEGLTTAEQVNNILINKLFPAKPIL